MTDDEARVRPLYLYVACSQAIGQVTHRLLLLLPPSLKPDTPLLERTLKRELALLFRFWASRQIWTAWDTRESDAKRVNLALLRLFVDGFKLPKDGSGLRYAELASVHEESLELCHRVSHTWGQAHEPLLQELQREVPPWHMAVMKHATDALELPVATLSAKVKGWLEQP